MKPNILSIMTSTCRTLFVGALALVTTSSLHAAPPPLGTPNFFDDTILGNINLGNASGGYTLGHKSWAIFAISGGVTITDPVAGGQA